MSRLISGQEARRVYSGLGLSRAFARGGSMAGCGAGAGFSIRSARTPAEYFGQSLLAEWSADEGHTVDAASSEVATIASLGFTPAPLVGVTYNPYFIAFHRNNRAAIAAPNTFKYHRCDQIAAALSGTKVPFTMVYAGLHATTPAFGVLWSLGNSGSNNQYHLLGQLSGKNYISRHDDAGAGTNTSSAAAEDTNFHVFTHCYAGDTAWLSLDGGAADPTGAFGNTTGVATYNEFGINGLWRITVGNFAATYWSHFLVIGRAITATEHAWIIAYLNRKGHGPAVETQIAQMVAIGNSHIAGGGASVTTNGWSFKCVDALRGNLGKSLCYYNSGIGSQKTTTITAHILEECNQHFSGAPPAKIVIVQEIINDYVTPTSVANCKINMTALVTAIHAAHPTAKVVNCPLYPHSSMSEVDRADLNGWLAARSDGADLALDWSSLDPGLMAAGENTHTTWYAVDQIHLNDAGHAACAAVSAPQIATLL